MSVSGECEPPSIFILRKRLDDPRKYCETWKSVNSFWEGMMPIDSSDLIFFVLDRPFRLKRGGKDDDGLWVETGPDSSDCE